MLSGCVRVARSFVPLCARQMDFPGLRPEHWMFAQCKRQALVSQFLCHQGQIESYGSKSAGVKELTSIPLEQFDVYLPYISEISDRVNRRVTSLLVSASKNAQNTLQLQQQAGLDGGPPSANQLPPSASYLEVVYPFAESIKLRDIYRLFQTDRPRFGLLLEDMDIIAADVCWRHMVSGGCHDSMLTLVTAAVDRIKWIGKISLLQDLKICGQVTWSGKSSIEVLLRVYQQQSAAEVPTTEVYIGEARFVMVARDKNNEGGFAVPPVVPVTEEDQRLYEMGEENQRRRRAFRGLSLQRCIPTPEELEAVHSLYAQTGLGVSMWDRAALGKMDVNVASMSSTTRSSVVVMHSQLRNSNYFMFGGYLLNEARHGSYASPFLVMGALPRMALEALCWGVHHTNLVYRCHVFQSEPTTPSQTLPLGPSGQQAGEPLRKRRRCLLDALLVPSRGIATCRFLVLVSILVHPLCLGRVLACVSAFHKVPLCLLQVGAVPSPGGRRAFSRWALSSEPPIHLRIERHQVARGHIPVRYHLGVLYLPRRPPPAPLWLLPGVHPTAAQWPRQTLHADWALLHRVLACPDNGLVSEVAREDIMQCRHQRAFSSAWATAYAYIGGEPSINEVYDVSFLDRVPIGAIMDFRSKIVYTLDNKMWVHVEAVLLENGAFRVTNEYCFEFSSNEGEVRTVVPETYAEAMQYIYGMRYSKLE
ncbi:hypothetical protein CYMTET_14801 [Cymbomonas tetramitiformis]|uniref:HotDog ACOT-type domain-containing protein n=1 Tax=Cymbomonas tetramitiformis TaxID=36881 RepID=A0AAE0GGU2_9CHLO|nr:hypothetical protein CYMTET_14801 [Cymbomonas tetramitiformis]